MKYDIAHLLTQALTDIGIMDRVDAGLSSHAPILLEMKDGLPGIRIQSMDNDEVWVWSQLGEFSLNTVTWSATNLMPLLLEHDESQFHLGQPALCLNDNELELCAQIKECHLGSPDSLMAFLNSFLARIEQFRAALA